MAQLTFKVNLNPRETLALVKERQNADLVYEEFHDLGNNKTIGTLVFERYYFRSSNRAALIVFIDNVKESTEVRAISTGSSQGLFLKLDWGASHDFVRSVQDIFKDYPAEE